MLGLPFWVHLKNRLAMAECDALLVYIFDAALLSEKYILIRTGNYFRSLAILTSGSPFGNFLINYF